MKFFQRNQKCVLRDLDSCFRRNDKSCYVLIKTIVMSIFGLKSASLGKSNIFFRDEIFGMSLTKLILFSEPCGGDVEELAILCNGSSGEIFNAGFR